MEIGIGSMVTRDIPSNSVAAGVQTQIIETLDGFVVKRIARELNNGHVPLVRDMIMLNDIVHTSEESKRTGEINCGQSESED